MNTRPGQLFIIDNPYTEIPDNANLKSAIAKAFYAFKLDCKVKMLHLNDLFQQKDLDIWNESPGLPWKEHGYRTKGDIRDDPEAVNKVRHFWYKIKRGENLAPPNCLAIVPSDREIPGGKQISAVWEYPATITFGEAVFCVPLIKAYKESGPLAFETATGGIQKIYKRFEQYKKYAGLHFEKFDNTVPAWLIEKVFLILVSNIDFCNYDEYGIPHARRMTVMFGYLEKYFINTYIRTANGRFRESLGIPSGSYFSQLIRSVCNYILCQWIAIELTGDIARDIIVQGDQSLMATEKTLDLKRCDALMKSIGMKINMKKSQISTEFGSMKFLGHRIGNGDPRTEHSEHQGRP